MMDLADSPAETIIAAAEMLPEVQHLIPKGLHNNVPLVRSNGLFHSDIQVFFKVCKAEIYALENA
jgi:hypothetical protein